MQLDFSKLSAAVQASMAVEAAALATIQQLASGHVDVAAAQQQVDALTAQLTTNQAALQAAVAANTPATPAA